MTAVIFDCDGVLVDSEALAEKTLAAHLSQWLPDLDIPQLLGQALGMTTANILRHVEQLSRYQLPVNAVAQVDSAIEMRLARELQPIDGARAALSAISLPKAVVSNSHRRRVVASLAGTHLTSVLGDVPIFTADQVAHPKPDPALYLLAAAELGFPAEHCLVVEDSVAGVTAARAAGMCVIGFIGASHVDAEQTARLLQAGAWRILAHMQDLTALVDEWLAHTETAQMANRIT